MRAAAPRCRRAASTTRPSRAGHARRRLLQVRHQLLRSGLPERRQLPDRRACRPRAGYETGYSQLIPPLTTRRRRRSPCRPARAAPDDAIAGTTDHCEVQPSEFAPPPSVAAQQPRHGIPAACPARRQPGAGLEPDLQQPHPARSDADAASSRSPRRRRWSNVTRGQLVPYTITVKNALAVPADRRQRRRPLSGRLQLRRGLRALRRSCRSSRRWPARQLVWRT